MRRTIPVLGQGSVELVGHSIDFVDLDTSCGPENTYAECGVPNVVPSDLNLDAAIARAARVSYQAGTKQVSDDAGLIDYLMRHRHTSPFEMVEFKFRLELPLFVVQQLLRHRTASVNQESARYSILEDKVWRPELRLQSKTNKQGSSDELVDGMRAQVLSDQAELAAEEAFAAYHAMLDAGVAREVARSVLPHGTFTKLVWKIDLHNLLHFLRLRLDPHAQKEIREVAEAMLELIRPYVPLTIKSWENHVLNAVTFSADEMQLIRQALNEWQPSFSDLHAAGLSKSRIQEFRQKLAI